MFMLLTIGCSCHVGFSFISTCQEIGCQEITTCFTLRESQSLTESVAEAACRTSVLCVIGRSSMTHLCVVCCVLCVIGRSSMSHLCVVCDWQVVHECE